jgi:hypothetical protein
MPAATVYPKLRQWLQEQIEVPLSLPALERITLLVFGILQAESASPAKVAGALRTLGLSGASRESIERRIRRIENDPTLSAERCVHPLARAQLRLGAPKQLFLLLDPTYQEDQLVLLSVAVWYRGRALPLAWEVWPANTPLTGLRFWERVAALLDTVALLLPTQTEITWLADRAFGSPAFTDLVTARGWHYVVRVQGQTHYREQQGRERRVDRLVSRHHPRAKGQGQLFKKQGWRTASVVVYWGEREDAPLCIVSDWPPRWELVHCYRRRYAIEALFRHYKSQGWRWEQGQVRVLAHVERLLVGMALATWVALCLGTDCAEAELARPATGRRHTRPPQAKLSLFSLGLQQWKEAVSGDWPLSKEWRVRGWDAPNWEDQILRHHLLAFILGVNRKSRST